MTTVLLSNDDHLEIFSIIWLDENVNAIESQETEQKLRSIINYLKRFQTIQQYQQFIEQTKEKDRLILIVSGKMGQDIVPWIHHLRQVISIYVYCMNRKKHEEWALKYKKVKAVVIDLDELISQIRSNYKIEKKVHEPLSINIYITDTSTTNVNVQFVFSQVFIDCLLRLKSTQTDKYELIHLYKKQYEGNPIELSNLQEFEQHYSSDKVLWWYTRDSFFSKTLNAALNTQNIHMIYLFRGFINDIHRSLQKYQVKKRIRVYRAQMISNKELKTLKESLDQFISFNSFFSTTTDYNIALRYLEPLDYLDNLEKVIFQIDAHPKMVTTKPFAYITEHSYFTDEPKVIFMTGSIFHLHNITRNDDNVWIIRMTLYSNDEQDLKYILTCMKQQIGDGETNLCTLGKILFEMGKLDLAEKFDKHLIEELEKLASARKDCEMSIQWYEKSLIFKEQNKSTLNRLSGKIVQLFSGRRESGKFIEKRYVKFLLSNI